MTSPQRDIGAATKPDPIIVLRNGQRKYGGPPINWSKPLPTKGSEVFVGKIPRDLTEDDLLPIFETIGPVFEIRLMMDFNGGNRGFAFVTFATPTDAAEAIRRLNRYEIRPRRFIGVIRSVDNCRLFVGGIPKDKTEEDIRSEMSRVTVGVVGVILYSSIADKSKNRGFAFVEYESHRAAAVARRKCMPGQFQLWGKNVAIDWAEPEPIVEEEILSQVRILYMRNVSISTKEEELQDLFNAASGNGVEKVKILNDFAFVHFASRDQAQQAMDALQNYEMKGSKLQITWAKPATGHKRSDNLKLTASRKASQMMSLPSFHMTSSHLWPYMNPCPINPQHVNYAHRQTFIPSTYQFDPDQRPVIGNYILSRRDDNMHAEMLYSGTNGYSSEILNFSHNQRSDVGTSTTSIDSFRPPWMKKVYVGNNFEVLNAVCQMNHICPPIIDIYPVADNRYSAKVSFPSPGPPLGLHVVQSTQNFETEEEARQTISGFAINYLFTAVIYNNYGNEE